MRESDLTFSQKSSIGSLDSSKYYSFLDRPGKNRMFCSVDPSRSRRHVNIAFILPIFPYVSGSFQRTPVQRPPLMLSQWWRHLLGAEIVPSSQHYNLTFPVSLQNPPHRSKPIKITIRGVTEYYQKMLKSDHREQNSCWYSIRWLPRQFRLVDFLCWIIIKSLLSSKSDLVNIWDIRLYYDIGTATATNIIENYIII